MIVMMITLKNNSRQHRKLELSGKGQSWEEERKWLKLVITFITVFRILGQWSVVVGLCA